MVIVACSIGAAHFSHWAGTRGGFTVEDGDVKEMFHTLETSTLEFYNGTSELGFNLIWVSLLLIGSAVQFFQANLKSVAVDKMKNT